MESYHAALMSSSAVSMRTCGRTDMVCPRAESLHPIVINTRLTRFYSTWRTAARAHTDIRTHPPQPYARAPAHAHVRKMERAWWVCVRVWVASRCVTASSPKGALAQGRGMGMPGCGSLSGQPACT